MKRSNVLTSERTFGRRAKARLNQILEAEQSSDVNCATNERTKDQDEDWMMTENIHDHDDDDNGNSSGNDGDGDDDDNSSGDDDDDEGDARNDYGCQGSLEMKLWKWAIERKITLAALTELLKILQPYVDSPLPPL
jgi:ABC-type Zn2+ transport system substrate-binding protein/surface adhesin